VCRSRALRKSSDGRGMWDYAKGRWYGGR
jgi:hypothetical protein